MATDNRTPTERFHHGARISNKELIALRALNAAMLKDLPAHRRPTPDPEAVAIARAQPTKGWAKRYLRAHGLPFNRSVQHG